MIPDDDETPDIGQDAKQDATMEDIQDDDPASKEESIASKGDNILLHPEAKSLEEIIGAKVVTNVLVGDKNPRNFGFRDIHHMFGELHEHIQKTKYVPQRDHKSMMDQTNMSKYEDWTKEMKSTEKLCPSDQEWHRLPTRSGMYVVSTPQKCSEIGTFVTKWQIEREGGVMCCATRLGKVVLLSSVMKQDGFP